MVDLALIINPDAGQMRALDPQRVIDAAQTCGSRAVEVFNLQDGFDDAIDAALSCGAERVAIAGGDGTAVSVLDAARARGISSAMVPLPLGTANLLPRRLYGDRDYEAVLTELDDYTTLTLPAGQVAGRSFFVALMAGVPVRFGQAREAMRPDAKGRQPMIALGRTWQGMQQLSQPRLRLSVKATETRLTRRSAIISIPGGLRAQRNEGEILPGLEHRLLGEGELTGLALQSASLMSLGPALDGVSEVSDEPARLEGPRWIRLLLDGELVRVRGPVTLTYVEEGGRFAAPKPE